MSTLPIFICTVILVMLMTETYILFIYKHEQENSDIERYGMPEDEQADKTDILIKILDRLSCKYKIDEKSELISILYNDETLLINPLDNKPYILIIDPWWYEAPIDDIENLALIRNAVNSCNYSQLGTLIYKMDKEIRKVGIHTLKTVFWIDNIPVLKEYLNLSMAETLHIRHLFYAKMEDLRRQSHKTEKDKE